MTHVPRTRARATALLSALTALLLARPSAADCPPDDGAAAAFFAAWRAARPVALAVPATLEAGRCAQRRFEALLAAERGRPVGYKAGLTSEPAQRHFGVDHPLRGTLYPGMLLDSGSTVTLDYAARPVLEADLLVRVGDGRRLMAAKTRAESLAALDAVFAFIELADLVVERPEALGAPGILAINVGARSGVRGPARATRDLSEATFADLVVVLSDRATGDGPGERPQELVRGRGTDLLGHPLDVVLWLARSVAAEGGAIEDGALLSLGTFGRPGAPVPGHTYTVTYEGLDLSAVVHVADVKGREH